MIYCKYTSWFQVIEDPVSDNLKRQWEVRKERFGVNSDTVFGPRRDYVEHSPTIHHPTSSIFLPYNWWIIAAG